MKRRAQSGKSHSWWWDSHISHQNSKWLSENLEEMEKQVKQILGLIGEEGKFSAEKAEAFYEQRPLLITHVENFNHMYRALAARYDSVTGELRKIIPSSLQSHDVFGVSESDSETQSSSSPGPESDMQENMTHQKQKSGPDCLDISIGSGVSSDISKKGSEGSSSSSDSDSELDEAKEENGSIFYSLSQKIIELEDELREARGKLNTLEEKNAHCQGDFGADSKVAEPEEKLQTSDEPHNLQKDLEESNSALESLTKVISEKEALEAVLLQHKNEIEVLKGELASADKKFEVGLAHRDLEIDKCKHELELFSKKYLNDKSTLEDELRKLQGVINNMEGDLAKMSQEKMKLMSRIAELEKAANSLEYSASEIEKLQEVIRNTQAELEKVAEEKEVLKERANAFEQLCRALEVSGTEVAKLPVTIKNLEAQLERALEEKSLLHDQIKELEQVMSDSLEKHSHEHSSLSADLLKLSEAKASLEGKLSSVAAELMQVYADKEEESLDNEKQISVLNQDITDLRSKLELLSSEKATVDDKLANLLADITARDEKMKQMDDHLNQLQFEHAELMAEFDAAHKSLSELRVQVSELEEEVEKQKLVISESAEGKREVIRQLCFSIEHYRSGYQELRQLLQGHRRPLVMAT